MHLKLSLLDWSVIVTYLGGIMLLGLRVSRSIKSSKQFFVGDVDKQRGHVTGSINASGCAPSYSEHGRKVAFQTKSLFQPARYSYT